MYIVQSVGHDYVMKNIVVVYFKTLNDIQIAVQALIEQTAELFPHYTGIFLKKSTLHLL